MSRKWPKAFAVAAIFGLGFVSPDAIQPFVRSGSGVRLVRLEPETVFHEDNVEGRAGDFLLESDSIALVVGASQVTPERRLDFGRITDLTPSSWSDEALEHFGLEVKVGGRPVSLTAIAVRPVIGGAAPAIRILHEALDGRLRLSTTVSLRAGAPYADIVTRVENDGRVPLSDVQVGDRIAWPAFPTFVPGLGEVETPGQRELTWFGMRGEHVSYAVVYPDAPQRVEFRADHHPEQVAWSPPRSLGRRQRFTLRRHFIGSFRGLAHAASWVHTLARTKVGHVIGKIEPVPVEAWITAVAMDGTIALRSQLEPDGSFDLPLVSGRYSLLLHTSGGVTDLLVDVDSDGPPTFADFVVARPGSLVFRVTDSGDRPMPARITVRGIASTPDPVFGPDFRAAGAKNEIHTSTGSGAVELPTGRYEVQVTRGPEYSLVRRRVTVQTDQGAAVWAILVRELALEDWVACDFHLHAAPSPDSQVSLADRVASLLASGVEFAVATDHNHVTDYEPAVRLLQSQELLDVAVGVEVTTQDFGHFNAFPIEPSDQPPPFARVRPAEIFAHVRKQLPRSLIQVNHPWMPGYGYFKRALLNEKTGEVGMSDFSIDFDTLEVINGFDLARPAAFEENLRRWFDLLNLGYRQTAVGNSDSHRISGEWAGYPRTYVPARAGGSRLLAERIAESLRAGRAVVSNGPFVELTVDGAGMGDVVSISEGVASVSVRVHAADWVDVDKVDIVVDGMIVDVLPASDIGVGGVRIDRVVEVPLTSDAWIVAVARGDEALDPLLPGMKAAPFAFTNPVYVDGDGDGRYEAPADREDVREGPPPPPKRRPEQIRSRAVDAAADAGDAAPMVLEPVATVEAGTETSRDARPPADAHEDAEPKDAQPNDAQQ